MSGVRCATCFVVIALLVALPARTGLDAQATPATRHLLIVLDGLRPDFVTRDVMPALHALGRRGVVFTNHHAVFPTVTRVNASSFSTGTYPERHGLLGNSVFFPQVDPARFLATDDRSNLLKIEAGVGRLLTVQTLGEVLRAAGRSMLAVSAGSTGSAFLLNHAVSGGAVLHHEYSLPESIHEQVVAELGQPNPRAGPDEKNRRAVDAFLRIGLPRVDPAVTVLWLTDPDTTAHLAGIGAPATVTALRQLDGQLERVLDGLAERRLLDAFDVWVTSDHGFSTYTGAPSVEPVLKPFMRSLPDGSPRIAAGGGAIYVRDRDRAAIHAIVRGLQQTKGVGAIFTRGPAGSLDGEAPGTLSFEAARWDHERSADILFSPDWTDGTNAFRYRGTSASGGVAGHGSSSPFDIHNVLIAAGSGLKSGAVVRAPSGNVDFAPTFLQALGIPVPSTMQGRVLHEAFAGRSRAPSARRVTHTVRSPDGAYVLTVQYAVLETGGVEYRYLDRTTVRRSSSRSSAISITDVPRAR
jgi:predicted AlkP superfamily pyrophosphatase or phosphodiesterase